MKFRIPHPWHPIKAPCSLCQQFSLIVAFGTVTLDVEDDLLLCKECFSAEQIKRKEIKTLHKEWVTSMMHDQDLIPMFKEKIKELDEAIVVEKAASNIRFFERGLPFWYQAWSLAARNRLITALESQRRRFESHLSVAKGKAQPTFQITADSVRDVPIGSVFDVPPARDSSDRASYLCPIHNEKTPSFVWYKKDNRYHCFGCQAHGDVIDLSMKIHGFSFKEALTYLSHM